MDDDESLYGFSNSLNEVRCSISEDSVENPLLETQFFIRLEVSTKLFQLGNINSRFELTADSIQITETRLPLEIVEFPFNVSTSSSNGEEEEEDDDDEEEVEDDDDDDDDDEEEEEEEDEENVYGDIDRLVSNRVIRSRFSQTLKNVLSRSRSMLMEIAIVEKPKWIRLILDIEVTKIYLELEEDDYEQIVNRVTRESFEADDENGNAVKPALRVSIEALETKKFEKEDDLLVAANGGRIKSCGICLDEFCMGMDFVTKMPCLHEFHKGCIFKWLETRSTCPLCRFEMPTL